MKTKILNELEAQRGKFVSGEELADSLGVSRAAVWKSIEILRKEGHKITAVTNKGYMLEKFSDVLTEKGIKKNLSADTKISQVICLLKTDSTNNFAKHLAMNGEPHGTLVTANYQTAGRGRRGHTFESPAGTGLYMSLILRPNSDSEKFQMITVADAVAVCMAVEELYPKARGNIGIKWVNDVYFRGRKISGILTEAVTGFESGEIESVVTGIGINVSTKNFSTETSLTAGSIFSEDNDDDDEQRFSRDELCARVADLIMSFADDLDNPEIINAYRKRSILTGQDITYMKDDRIHYAHVIGIDDSGGLMILNDEGVNETLRSGEVFSVRKEKNL